MNKTDKLFASLKLLGINPRMETFSERKKVQKAVYLLDKTFGLNFDYSYNWYLYGPYSPEVTQIIFRVLQDKTHNPVNTNILQEEEIKKIKRMKEFLGSDIQSTDQLELLASVQFLLDCAGNSRTKENKIIDFLKQKKPYFGTDEVRRVIKRLEKLKN
jgi:uncharacterized protein YwgA